MRYFLLIAAVPLAAAAACSGSADGHEGVPASGSGTARTFQVADFSGVELRGSDDVDVRVGKGFSVRAEGPSAELDMLKIEKVGNALRVGRKDSNMLWGGNHHGVKVYVTMPRIAAAAIAGSGNMAIDRVEGDRFTGDSAGSGDLSIGALAVQAADLSLAGSGNVSAKGSAKALKISVAGAGDVEAAGLKAASAKVSVAGSGNVTAQVDGSAEVSVIGSGDVDLGKGARCTTTKIGSGDVTCGR
jgi:hypothetical protein